ncbi:MAG TPA: SDR family NAD(P)-dependent oxidoreductase [Verrucomicrobiota bacterium]|nr:short-chain dehydrogenase [Verrucomicrobiales bacterium]HRI15521.1 SDR family NAD(P)-dependent oxidoreductase [Verrucomicrobiota bacterium]
MFSLAGKLALVTGAGSGIGAAIAETFGAAGAVVIVADVNEVGGRRTVATIEGARGEAEFVLLDVTSEAACNELADQVHEARGPLDVLVNNAGIGHVGTLLTTTGVDFDRVWSVNVRGLFNVTRAFLPAMVERGRGSVINLASSAGVEGLKDRFAYSTSKHAVVGMTRCLALDHAKSGVRVNCLCPGRVETPFVKSRLAEYPDPEVAYREMCSTQANGRMGRPDEIAAFALYLAADESSFVTGAALSIDGGMTAGSGRF